MILPRLSALLLAFTLLGSSISSAEAGWPKFGRWFGEGWSNGYHAPGSHWTEASIHASQYEVSTGEVYVPGQIDHLPRLWHLPLMPPPTEALPVESCPAYSSEPGRCRCRTMRSSRCSISLRRSRPFRRRLPIAGHSCRDSPFFAILRPLLPRLGAARATRFYPSCALIFWQHEEHKKTVSGES